MESSKDRSRWQRRNNTQCLVMSKMGHKLSLSLSITRCVSILKFFSCCSSELLFIMIYYLICWIFARLILSSLMLWFLNF
jgi:hypothetical protein